MDINLSKDLPVGTDSPNSINVIVEIPRGSRNKYEFDKITGALRLGRVLYSSIHYPNDYGLIPQTFYDNGDPLDVLVMVNEPAFPAVLYRRGLSGSFE